MGANCLMPSVVSSELTRIATELEREAGPQPGPAYDFCRQARLAERTRIAEELHDTLLQGFHAFSMQLQSAVDHIPVDSGAKPRFDNLVLMMRRVLEQGRLAVFGLRSLEPEVACGGGSGTNGPTLGHSLAGVPAELGLTSAAVHFRVMIEGRERELEPSLAKDVYRIGREAIVNAYRHSGATHIDVLIEYRRTDLRLVVSDNGCGIDCKQLTWTRNEHWGLRSMRDRAERIGARLNILSRVALGTEIELRVAA